MTESLARAPGEKIVSERIEIRDYVITPNLARGIARERLARAWVQEQLHPLRGAGRRGAEHPAPLRSGALA